MNFSCLVEANTSILTTSRWTYLQDDGSAITNGYVSATIALLFFIFGAILNGFIISTVILKQIYQKTPSVLLLLNLVISNFLVCLTIFPFIIGTGFAGEFKFGSTDAVRCGFCWMGTLNITLPSISLITLALLAVDRWVYLKKPLVYHKHITSKRVLVAIFIVWIFSSVISIPPLFGVGSIGFAYAVSSCVPRLVGRSNVVPNYYYAMIIAAVAFISISTIVVSYVSIVKLTRKHLLRNVEYFVISTCSTLENAARKQVDRENLRKQFKMVQLFGAIFTANVLTWIPMFGMAVTSAIIGTGNVPTAVYSFAYMSLLSEVIIHPILEVAMIRQIREVIMKWLSSLFRRLWTFIPHTINLS